MNEVTGQTVEVMVYGDGAFKHPVGKICELADPVDPPAYTTGLDGQPNEIKLKYLADSNFADLRGDELTDASSEFIDQKEDNHVDSVEDQGTTRRKHTDLLMSLSGLTAGS